MPKTGKVARDVELAQNAAQEAAINTLEEKELASVNFATNGALTKTTGTKALTKGSAGAYTLAAPTAAEEGAEVTIVSDSAFAHVVTATALINDGVTGGAKTTMTFAAFVGASIRLLAHNLKWTVVAKNAVTIT